MTKEQKEHIVHLFTIEECINCKFKKECTNLLNATVHLDNVITLCKVIKNERILSEDSNLDLGE